MITAADAPVGPMPNSDLPTFGSHPRAASGAAANEAGLRFLALTFDVGEMHLTFLHFKRSPRDRRCQNAGQEHVSLMLVLLFFQRWPEKLCRWLSNGECCSASWSSSR